MNPHDSVLAACLTPPAPGGIAVVQVTGRDSAGVVGPMLRTKRALDLERMALAVAAGVAAGAAAFFLAALACRCEELRELWGSLCKEAESDTPAP